MSNKRQLFLIIILSFGFFSLEAQIDNFVKGKEYILDTIIVKGLVTFQDRTVISYTGLRPGQKINIPGEDISNIISKLWKLDLFSDINFYLTDIIGDRVVLQIEIKELPKLTEVKVKGLKKSAAEEIIKETDMTKGKKLSENFLTNTKNYIINKYEKKGYYNTKVVLNTIPDSIESNGLKMVVNIDRGKKVKINDIVVSGNEKIKTSRILKKLKKTKKKNFFRFYKRSKFISEEYEEGLVDIVDYFKEKGYRDARIIKDSVVYDKSTNAIGIFIDLEEGRRYYFGEIKFLGNSIYTTQQLEQVLGIKKGDSYNGVLLKKRINDPEKPDGNYIANLYQNNGYLFSSINPVEISAKDDTIDIEIRIVEGKIANFNKLTIKGNDRTKDHVIFREIRTKPGEKYSKDNIIRTIRELGQLRFFDQNIEPNFKTTDPNTGNVDIEYNLIEIGSSQVQLQGGYGAGGIIGTIGLTINNFSLPNVLNSKKTGSRYPIGDGQSLSLQVQATQFNNVYSISFMEPWLGGRQPVQFSFSISRSTQYQFNFFTQNTDRNQFFRITGFNTGLAKRLSVPDDFFILSQSISYRKYDLNNYFTGLFTFGNGTSNNLSYTISLDRNNTFNNPIYPVGGSTFGFRLTLSPPYSLFSGIDYENLENLPEYRDPITNQVDQGRIDQEKFRWLEFYKIKFNATWYTTIVDKLVLRTHTELGFLGTYNPDIGDIPFERFYLGGDGLQNFTLDGRENIALRGYPNQSLSSTDGSLIYNKFNLELRYPITIKPAATIFGLGFLEAGNGYNSFKRFNPFNSKRSMGIGVRIFMPAFGLIGIDFGYGFDNVNDNINSANGWETHFTIGQRF